MKLCSPEFFGVYMCTIGGPGTREERILRVTSVGKGFCVVSCVNKNRITNNGQTGSGLIFQTIPVPDSEDTPNVDPTVGRIVLEAVTGGWDTYWVPRVSYTASLLSEPRLQHVPRSPVEWFQDP